MAVAYDPENVFAKILRGEIPSHKVYEDEVALAIMDIMPRAEGHVLVIPKKPARGLLDIASDDLSALITRVQLVAKARNRRSTPTASRCSSSTRARAAR